MLDGVAGSSSGILQLPFFCLDSPSAAAPASSHSEEASVWLSSIINLQAGGAIRPQYCDRDAFELCFPPYSQSMAVDNFPFPTETLSLN